MEFKIKNTDNTESTINLDAKTLWESVLKDDEAKKLYQSDLDSKISKGINTFKEQSLPKLVEDEISKRYPAETPEQKKMKELELKIAELDKKNQTERLNAFKLQEMVNNKIPVEFKDFINGDSEDTVKTNIDTFNKLFGTKISEEVQNKFKDNGRTPKTDDDKGLKKYTLEQVKNMTKEEFGKLKPSQIITE